MAIPLIRYPEFRPYSNVQPFTVQDGATYALQIETLLAWIKRDLVPHIDKEIAELSANWDETALELIGTWEQMSAALIERVELAEETLGNAVDDAEAAQIAAEAARDLAEIYASQAEAIQDVAISNILSDSESDTREALGLLYASKAFIDSDVMPHIAEITGRLSDETLKEDFTLANENVVNVGRFGLDVDTISQAVNLAVQDSPEGSTIKVPRGEYTATEPISNAGKSVTLDFTGVKIVQGFNGTLANFSGGFEPTVNVSSISETYFQGRNVHVITLENVYNVEQGDIVKIISDDVIAESRPESSGLAYRQGEFATVAAVSGTSITLSAYLFDTYTTNIRLAKLKDISVHWIGGEFTASSEAMDNNWTNGVIYMTALKSPSVRGFTIKRSSSLGIEVRSCHSASISDYHVGYLTNAPSTGNYGYALNDVASESTQFYNSVIGRVRHAYTDDTPRTLINADILNYGRTKNAIVSNVSVNGHSSGAFSPHHSGYGHTFIGCTASNGMEAFSLRGRSHKVLDCSSFNNFRSVVVWQDESQGGGQSFDHYVRGMFSQYSAGSDVYVSNSRPLFDIPETLFSMTIDGGRFENSSGLAVVDSGNINFINNPLWIASEHMNNDSAAIRIIQGRVKGDSLTLDYSRNSFGNNLVGITQGGSTPMEFTIDGLLTVKDSNGRLARLFNNTSGGSGNSIWKVDKAILDTLIPVFPSGSFSTLSRVSWETRSGVKSSIIEREDDSVAAGLGTLASRLSDGDVILRCREASDTSRTLGMLNAGAFTGQKLTVSWKGASGSPTLTILASDRGVDFGSASNYILENGQAVTLFWDNTIWRPIS